MTRTKDLPAGTGSGSVRRGTSTRVDEAAARGRAARSRLARRALAEVALAPGRDPVARMASDEAGRLVELLPLRRERMGASPFAFYRGSAGLMAADLAAGPDSGLVVQACGDAHLANFGVFASPERRQLFDLNDFDETNPAPFEWDVKRLTTSAVLAARDLGLGSSAQGRVASAAAASYRKGMQRLAELGELDVWYRDIPAERIVELVRHTRERRRGQMLLRAATTRDSHQAARKLTTVVDGRRRFIDRPPLLERVVEDVRGHTTETLAAYVATLPVDRRMLLDRYEVLDVARKVVGVGSVGTRCYVALLEGQHPDDVLILQLKEAGPSVLEEFTGPSAFTHHGRRVVIGERLLQAQSDIFLGWTTGPDGRDYYWRQLRDMKYSVDLSHLDAESLELTAGVSGWALARAHAKSGDRIAIAGYLGGSRRADDAFVEFSVGYADQVERDHSAVVESSARRDRTDP
jgi:uncharacterized protein (DUF2252 family)